MKSLENRGDISQSIVHDPLKSLCFVIWIVLLNVILAAKF